MRLKIWLGLAVVVALSVVGSQPARAEGPDPVLIKRMTELSEKLQKASEAEKPAIMEALKKNAEEMMKQVPGKKATPPAAQPKGGKTSATPPKNRKVHDFMDVFQLGKQGKVEAIVNVMQSFLSDPEVPKENLFQFYNASLWTALSLHDTRRALILVQAGLDRCNELLAAGDRDIHSAGDEGVFFQWCNLNRAKAQILAMANRVDDAKNAADEVMKKIWESYSTPKTAAIWKKPENLGFFCLFQQSALPVIEAVNRMDGEEEAANLMPWVEAALASETIMLDTLGKAPGISDSILVSYRRMLVQARGQMLLLAGKAQEAVDAFEKYQWAGLNPKRDFYMIYPLMSKGRALAKAGKEKEGLEVLKQADEILDDAKKAGNIVVSFSRWWPSLYSGQIHEKAGRIEDAIKAYQKAIGYLRELYANVSAGNARREFAKENDLVYARLIRLFLEQGKTQEAFNCLEESQSKAMLDLFGDIMQNQKRDWPADIKEKALKLKKELMDLENDDSSSGSGSRGKSSITPEERRSMQLKLLNSYEQMCQEGNHALLEKKQKEPAASFFGKSANIVQGKDLQNQILIDQPELMTIVFQTREDPCWILVAGGKNLQAVKLTATAAQIRSAAGKMRKALTGESDEWKEPASNLYKLLISPIEEKIKGKERLVIIPDGALWYVPFSALMDEKGAPLVNKYRTGIVSGVGLAAMFLKNPANPADDKKEQEMMVFANPDGSLPHASEEGRKIAELAKGKAGWKLDLFDQKEAKKARFLENVEKPACSGIHFATHGILDEANPLYSYLLLGGGEGQTNHLDISEIATDIDLHHLKVVALSACNTAIGALSGGNEVVCLQNAFQEAGVRTVLASLWEVSDESTAKLMTSFYTHWFSGKTPGEALTLAMRENTSLHPNRWSAFQVYGLP